MKSVVVVPSRLSVAVLLLAAPMLVGANGEPEGVAGATSPLHGCGCPFQKDATDTPAVRLGMHGGGSLPLARWIRDSMCVRGGAGGTWFAAPNQSCFVSVYRDKTTGEWKMGCTS